jgi:hypothetical protein
VVLGLVVAALPGCISYCDCAPWLDRVSRGDPAAINELAELGRPRIPTSAIPLASIEDAFVAILPNSQSTDPYVRELAVDALRRLAERAPDVFRDRHVAAFDRALQDPLANVRYRAAWALGRVEIARPPLRALSRDPAPPVAADPAWKTFASEEAKRLEGIRKDRERIEAEQRARGAPIAPIASPTTAPVASPTPGH